MSDDCLHCPCRHFRCRHTNTYFRCRHTDTDGASTLTSVVATPTPMVRRALSVQVVVVGCGLESVFGSLAKHCVPWQLLDDADALQQWLQRNRRTADGDAAPPSLPVHILWDIRYCKDMARVPAVCGLARSFGTLATVHDVAGTAPVDDVITSDAAVDDVITSDEVRLDVAAAAGAGGTDGGVHVDGGGDDDDDVIVAAFTQDSADAALWSQCDCVRVQFQRSKREETEKAMTEAAFEALLWAMGKGRGGLPDMVCGG